MLQLSGDQARKLYLLCKPTATKPVVIMCYTGGSQLPCIDAIFPDRLVLMPKLLQKGLQSPAPSFAAPSPPCCRCWSRDTTAQGSS